MKCTVCKEELVIKNVFNEGTTHQFKCSCGRTYGIIAVFFVNGHEVTCREEVCGFDAHDYYVDIQLEISLYGGDWRQYLNTRIDIDAQKFFAQNAIRTDARIDKIYFENRPQVSWDLLVARIAMAYSYLKLKGAIENETCEEFAKRIRGFEESKQCKEEYLKIAETADEHSFGWAEEDCDGIISFCYQYNNNQSQED